MNPQYESSRLWIHLLSIYTPTETKCALTLWRSGRSGSGKSAYRHPANPSRQEYIRGIARPWVRSGSIRWKRCPLPLSERSDRRLPIVLHCVKAYEKLLSLMDRYTVPILFHGFTGSPQLACQLIRKGYFLSFGTTLFRSPRTQEALRTTPYEHLFLETDEADTTIEEIYRQAAALRNTPIETLKHSIYTNYKTLFG